MVAVSIPRLEPTPTLCSLRPLLRDAFECLDHNDTIGAAVRIRRVVALLLVAFAESCGIKRPLHRYPRPARIARALHDARRVDKSALEGLIGVIDACNASAHCEPVCAAALRDGAALILSLVETHVSETAKGGAV